MSERAISLPSDPEHFLHVGAGNLSSAAQLASQQNQLFHQVALNRTRRLPATPDDQPAAAASPASPSSSRRSLFRRKTPGKDELSVPGSPLTLRKAKKKDMDSLAFQAVEAGDINVLDELLSKSAVDPNETDEDGHTLLDVAVIMNNYACIHLLQHYRARETDSYADPSRRAHRLEALLKQKQEQLDHLSQQIKGGAKNLSKQFDALTRSCARSEMLYRKWNAVSSSASKPSPPSSVRLSPASDTSILVSVGDVPDDHGAAVTRYKVEYSSSPAFFRVSFKYFPARKDDHELEGLQAGSAVFVRVSAGNIKGFGRPTVPVPPSIVPSSWRDAEQDNIIPRNTLMSTNLAAILQDMVREMMMVMEREREREK